LAGDSILAGEACAGEWAGAALEACLGLEPLVCDSGLKAGACLKDGVDVPTEAVPAAEPLISYTTPPGVLAGVLSEDRLLGNPALGGASTAAASTVEVFVMMNSRGVEKSTLRCGEDCTTLRGLSAFVVVAAAAATGEVRTGFTARGEEITGMVSFFTAVLEAGKAVTGEAGGAAAVTDVLSAVGGAAFVARVIVRVLSAEVFEMVTTTFAGFLPEEAASTGAAEAVTGDAGAGTAGAFTGAVRSCFFDCGVVAVAGTSAAGAGELEAGLAGDSGAPTAHLA
jgi:hypothetical protein